MAQQPDKRVVVGRIAGLHGVRGWVKVQSHTDPAENLLSYQPWQICLHGQWREARAAESRAGGGGRMLARLEGIEDRDAAAALVGADLAVWRSALPEVGQGYYWADLVGLTVVDLTGATLGQVHSLLETGANDVLVVRAERERLVPFLPGQVVKDVDLAAGVIRVDWDADF